MYEAKGGKHASRSESKPVSASLHKEEVASQPDSVKPATDDEEAEEAVIGLPGVRGDSARGKMDRGTWEAQRLVGETRSTWAGNK